MDYQTKLKHLLELVVKKEASDLHIVAEHVPVLRVVRELVDLEDEPVLTSQDSEGLAFALMTPDQKEKFLKDKEVDFAYELGQEARFRVNVFYQRRRVSVAMRHIPPKIKTIEELGLPPILHSFAKMRQGLVLITGATSQGKSTTMAAIVDEVNHTRKEHIITIEQPIEYIFENDQSLIEQREVYQDTLSFARALRASLRQDPNVIMVGEMRDLETISIALRAAETGHLVVATLHTNSASQTIHRIIDVFPSHQQNQISAQLSASLAGVVSQFLMPGLKGGFVPACEIMFANSAIANLIRENKIHEIPSIIETSAQVGMLSMNTSLSHLVKKREVSKEAALRYSPNPEDLQSRLRTF